MSGWIGVDLDGTLAEYDGWQGSHHIGEPILSMTERVKCWLAEGFEVKIFTARVAKQHFDEEAAEECFHIERTIKKWCERHIGRELPVTCIKDMDMIELWDDRAVTVERNTGRALAPSTRGL